LSSKSGNRPPTVSGLVKKKHIATRKKFGKEKRKRIIRGKANSQRRVNSLSSKKKGGRPQKKGKEPLNGGKKLNNNANRGSPFQESRLFRNRSRGRKKAIGGRKSGDQSVSNQSTHLRGVLLRGSRNVDVERGAKKEREIDEMGGSVHEMAFLETGISTVFCVYKGERNEKLWFVRVGMYRSVRKIYKRNPSPRMGIKKNSEGEGKKPDQWGGGWGGRARARAVRFDPGKPEKFLRLPNRTGGGLKGVLGGGRRNPAFNKELEPSPGDTLFLPP